jgi:type II secretion system protein I
MRKRRIPSDPHRGFTLLEVILALAMVAIAVAAIVRLHLVTVRSTRQAQARQWATVIANNQIEKALGADSLKSGKSSGNELKGPLEFHWTTQVREKKSFAGLENLSGLHHVQVQTSWLDGPQQQSITLNAYITQ